MEICCIYVLEKRYDFYAFVKSPSLKSVPLSAYLPNNIKKTSPASVRTPGTLKTAATYSPACAVPSAMRSLTALFGMGRGGTSAP